MTLTFAGAYTAGGMANAADRRADITRLAEAAKGGYSEASLIGAAADWDEAALAVARRHDPYTVAGAPLRGRQTVGEMRGVELPSVLEQGGNSQAADGFQPARLSHLTSSRELDCLAKGVYFEARGEGTAGMEAVAQVIVNRARHPSFPKSICGVIYQGAGKGRGCQFSFACDGSMRKGVSGPLWDRARQIAGRTLDGEVRSPVGTATFFHATRISPNWRGLTRVATVGRHVFYRHAGARGSASMLMAKGQVFQTASAAPERGTLYKVARKSSDEGRVMLASNTEAAPAAEAASKPASYSLDAIVDAATES
ncbi:MAG TPA: cell wall hydrolase [Caulobacteraceae bacterium]|jgi:spore germination cell wall hydrolase CwlJ-like protein